jgi:hypothetical protein
LIGKYIHTSCLSAKRYGERQFVVQQGPFLPLIQQSAKGAVQFWQREYLQRRPLLWTSDESGALFAPFSAMARYLIVLNGFRWVAAMHASRLLYCRFAFYQFGLDAALRPRLYDLASVFRVPADARLFADNVTCSVSARDDNGDDECAHRMPHRCFSQVGEQAPQCQSNARCAGVDERGAVLAWCRVLQLFVARHASYAADDVDAGWTRRMWRRVEPRCAAAAPPQRWSGAQMASALHDEWLRRAQHRWSNASLGLRHTARRVYQHRLARVIASGIDRCQDTTQQFC